MNDVVELTGYESLTAALGGARFMAAKDAKVQYVFLCSGGLWNWSGSEPLALPGQSYLRVAPGGLVDIQTNPQISERSQAKPVLKESPVVEWAGQSQGD